MAVQEDEGTVILLHMWSFSPNDAVSHLTRLIFRHATVRTLSCTPALGLLLTQHILCTLAGNVQAVRICRKFLHNCYTEGIERSPMNSAEGSSLSATLWRYIPCH